MGLSIIALVMMTGTLSVREIAEQQAGGNWNIFYQPLGLFDILICAFAETNRAPFDLPECETELVGGYHTEYSSMKLGFYLFAEYINMFISSAIIRRFISADTTCRSSDRFITDPNALSMVGTLFLFGKIFFFIFFFMWVRWTFPRFRYDQLMNLGWKKLIPLSIINIFLTGIVMWLMGKLD